MLPILTFLSIAFAASLWPDSSGEESSGPETASGDLGASGTSTGEDGDANSPLSFASASAASTTDTLADSDSADDTIIGTDEDDMLFGEDGNDTLFGGAGEDVLDGGAGNDFIFGDEDAEGDELIGGEDHDDLWVGSADTATGGSGDDTFHLADEAEEAPVITDFNPDDDTVAVYYDAKGPVPQLKTEQTEDGNVRLLANDEVVAIFTGNRESDLEDIVLVREFAA